MGKHNSEDLSRRDFIGLSVGAAVVAGIGCGSDDKSATSGNTSQGGAATSSGGSGTAAPGTSGGASNATAAPSSTGGSSNPTTPSNGGGSNASSNPGATGGSSNPASSAVPTTGGTSTSSAAGPKGGAAVTSGGGASKGGASAAGSPGNGGRAGGAATGGRTSNPGAAGRAGANPVGNGGRPGAAGETGTPANGGSSTTTPPSGGKLVGIVRDADLVKATKDAIAAAGGLPDLTGKTVFLKPNLLASTASPCTPHPDVIKGVVQAVKAAGATTIKIGDSPASGQATSVMSSANTGIHTMLQAEGGVTEVNFSATSKVSPTGAAKWPSGISIYTDLLPDEAGNRPYIINICCCKHHGSAVWSLAMKNWYGIVPTADRKHVTSGQATQPQIAEIHLAVKEDFVVMDATKSYITGGPSSGTVASPGIVVATADAVAAEATGLAILRQYRAAGGVTKDDIENVPIFSTDAKTLMGRALTLGNGWISKREQYTYTAIGLGADEAAIIGQLDT